VFGAGSDDIKLTTEEEVRSVSVVEFQAIRDESTVVNGFVFFMDFTGFSMKHVTRWSMDDSKKWSNIWQVLDELKLFDNFLTKAAYERYGVHI
jgi:hypothetical protein